MRYQIIKEVDGNNKVMYQVRFRVKRWYGHTWEYISRYVCDGQFSVTKDFETFEEAEHAVNARVRIRSISQEGVINDHVNAC
jgi:hypothetical protein